jgi:hypothetical protein
MEKSFYNNMLWIFVAVLRRLLPRLTCFVDGTRSPLTLLVVWFLGLTGW